MKKILLVGASPINDSPYIQSYIEVYERNGIAFDLLFWNRHLDSTDNLPGNFISYNIFTDNKYPYWRRLLKIWGFARYSSKWMKKNEYDYVVVFTIAHAVFMYPTLKRFYKEHYIFDIRDYSPFCKIKILSKIINRLIEFSSFTVVSSAGFLRWLPSGEKYHYLVAHNTTKEMIKKYIEYQVVAPKGESEMKILTIGQLRDFESNSLLMDKLCLEKNIKIVFVGSGPASEALIQYAEDRHITNVAFAGRYEKKNEQDIVMSHHMVNALFGRSINSDSLMSNRFYLSVLMRKPLIVNKGSYQAEIVDEYGLGIVLDYQDNFGEKIVSYWKNMNWESYNRNCKHFLSIIQVDIDYFEQKIVSLLL